jgi:hypothetical protein
MTWPSSNPSSGLAAASAFLNAVPEAASLKEEERLSWVLGALLTEGLPPNITAQLPFVPTSLTGVALGVATLDGTGLVPLSQLPDLGGGVPVATTAVQGKVKVDDNSAGDPQALTAAGHGTAADPHPQYALDSEKGAANGIATLDAAGALAASEIPSSLTVASAAITAATIPTLNTTSLTATAVTSPSATLVTANITSLTATALTVPSATITTGNVTSLTATAATIATLNSTSLTATAATVPTLNTTSLTATAVTSPSATVTTGNVTSLTATAATTPSLVVGGGTALKGIRIIKQSLTPTAITAAAASSQEQLFTAGGISNITTADVIFINKPTTTTFVGIGGQRVAGSGTIAITYTFGIRTVTPAAELYTILAIRS